MKTQYFFHKIKNIQFYDFPLGIFFNLMHLSMLSPRGGGPGIPREFDSISSPVAEE